VPTARCAGSSGTRTRPEEGVVYGVARDVTDRHVANAELRALRRVATLVAEGAQPQDLFAVVAEEVTRVVDVPSVRVMWDAIAPLVPPGLR
jgi:hypothetical protein